MSPVSGWLSALRRTLRGMPGFVLLIAGGLVGILVGLALFTFGYAGGFNYFGNDPASCNQCHAMNEQYNAWKQGPHHHTATCNDCHAPHDSVIRKYVSKADNGFWHALKFTTGEYPENIVAREVNREIAREGCLYCHGDFVADMNMTRDAGRQTLLSDHTTAVDCLQCHSNVGHMR
ncbi:MAG: cytochrome c nitrite reductase small subunit [Propionibacteriaceae bacterium]|nr:cytochrome c nitrite reductase small subunit [Propionibacteriaceae bacterium]